jgi:TolB-like protein/DNA-binding winged helix-turn-helix (wHTH) protein/Tfp pilus assembly protein PilF
MQPLLRFGRDFELDPGTYQLRRAGRAIKLERIPMDILLLLAAERSRVVGREEIAEQVWGKDVCVDVDNSINGAIRKIRQALRDDPEQPRYIQTVTGRGYRFIATIAPEETPAEAATPIPTPEIVEPVPVDEATALPAAPPTSEADATPARSRPWWPVALIVALVLIAGAGLLWWRRSNTHATPRGPVRLAVLPFQNLTGDPGQDYFSDGFTEEMITQLGALDPQHLAVIARTSVTPYKDNPAPLTRIAHDLGVQYVLEGSVRRDANRVRVTAQLIPVREQTPVWSKEYDHDPQDLLVVQSEISRAIAKEIQSTLGARNVLVAHAGPRLSPQEYEAYDLYLKGRYLWSKRTPEDLKGAVSWFQQAIALDPNYAPAYAGLADSYAIMSAYGDVPTNQYIPLARAAAQKALQLDDSLAEAHTSLALIAQNYDWDWKTAEKEYRRAIELNPNYATAHHWLAECLAYQGRFDEALAESERARQLDPLSLIIATDNGAIYYFARQYDRAISRFKTVLDVDPSVGRAHLIVDAYVEQGKYADALAAIQRWRPTAADSWRWAMLAYVYGKSGDKTKALEALAELEKITHDATVDHSPVFDQAYSGIGDKDVWLDWLEEAVRQHNTVPTAFKVDPRYDPLRNEPRFQKLLRDAGFDNNSK